MSKIDTSTWKEFHIGDIFDVKSSKKKFNACDVVISEEGYPYVVRTSANNGIRGYIKEDPKYLNDGNTISFGQDTATMFYQPAPYFTGDKIKILQFKNGILNEQSAQFFLTVMRKAFSDFSWGVSSFDETIIKGVSIYLPVTEVEEVDFDYMEARIKELEEARIKELEEALRAMGLQDTKLTEDEAEALAKIPRFKEFTYDNLFELQAVKRKLSKLDFDNHGEIPVYSSDTKNNGVLGYTNQKPEFIVCENVPMYVVFGDHTRTMNIATESFCVLDNVKILKPKISDVEELLYIFAVWKKAIPNLGYARHWSVAKDAQIRLPINDFEEIDYKYMKSYIRAIEKQTIQKLYDDKGILIGATKKII